ncbi:stage II sporulation protein M [Candidatus Woesearchaeota archaeon]|nr:stage II sporulation protein M [Candidatus Woesearchaeota archaeon]
MVLELLVNPKKVTGKPWEMFFLGAIYSFVAAFLALWIFKNYVSIVMITLTIIASVPLMSGIINQEEEKDRSIKREKSLLKEHSKAIRAFVYLFLGFTFTFTMLYIFMPSAIVEKMFSAQLETIITVQSGSPTGEFIGSFGIFSQILMNNLKILLFCMAFSFFYGAGAIFILTWNASVMATAIGSFIRNNLFYAHGIFDYFQVTMFGLLQYLLHGIPEIVAYFIGALASGMVSFALVKHEYMDPKFQNVVKDVSILIGIAVVILIAAALIEVFLTPLII